MPARVVIQLKRIHVYGDGDPMGSADMQFRFLAGGDLTHFIGRYRGVSSGDTIQLDQRLSVNSPPSGQMDLGLQAVDEDEGDNEAAIAFRSTDFVNHTLPRRDLFVTAKKGDLSARLYFDLENDSVASDQSISEYVRVYDLENANGNHADLQDDVPGPTLTHNTMRLFRDGIEFSLSVGLYLSSTLNFPKETVSSIVLPGNTQVVVFRGDLARSTGGIALYSEFTDWVPGAYLSFDGPRGRIVNLRDHLSGPLGARWDNLPNSFRTDTLRVVGEGVRITAEPHVRVFSGPDGTGQWFDLKPENGRQVWRKEFHTPKGKFVLTDYDFDVTRFMGELPQSLLLNANTLLAFSAGGEPSGHHKLGGEPAGRMFNLKDLPRKVLRKPGTRPAAPNYAGVIKKIRASILSRG